MALPGTQLRFAYDLASHLSVQDLRAYYTGALYPDSRYYTQISRADSHGPHCPRDPFAVGLSDFERGWATHLLYDETVSTEQQRMVPASYPRTKAHGGLDDWWVYLTSLKTVEDMQSLQVEGIQRLFTYATSPVNPNKESKEKLADYYSVVRNVYKSPPTLDGYEGLMSHLHIPADRIAFWVQTLRALVDDTEVRQTVSEMYPRQLEKTLS